METSSEDFKILVADDSAVYRKLVENTLAEENYSVSFASNGQKARELFVREPPALVITDWEMPDVSGIELCREIRKQTGSYVYVILLTSNSNKGQIIEGLAAGADDYLTKPFHPPELLARVAVGRRIVSLHREIQAKNRLLEELALTDPLTGLANRRAIETWADRQLKAAARHKFPFWVVMADLDFFKSVNDTYGHDAGDLVLQRFAEVLRRNTRASNICGRIGGEEFVEVITHVERANIGMVVERIRQQLVAEKFAFGDHTIGVTASFGIAGFENQDRLPTLAQLMKEADSALYRAKRAGRNRIEFGSAEFDVAKGGTK